MPVTATPLPPWRALEGQLDCSRGAAIRARRRLALRVASTGTTASLLLTSMEAMLVLLKPVFPVSTSGIRAGTRGQEI